MKNTSHAATSLTRRALMGSVAFLTSLAPGLAAPSQEISEQRFNQPGDIQYLEGSENGASGSGVSGGPGDGAYAADATANPKAVGVIPPAQESRETDELTITAWYKPRTEMPDATTLFSAFGTLLNWDEKVRQWVWRVETSYVEPNESPYWFYSGKSPHGDWGAPGEWTFIALVWKREGNWVGFYQGSKADEAALVRQMNRNAEVKPLMISGSARNTIGNDKIKSDRPFNGEIDNIRFFGRTLDGETIEKIRKSDLANQALTLP